ncbi:MAG: hypothetical protein AAF467_25725 [Actinomycetota bacterium]
MFSLVSIDGPVRSSRWWYVLPGYLTIWSLVNGTWTFLDGEGIFSAFGIDVTVATSGDEFVLANSGARYLGVAAALVVGVFVVDSAAAALAALCARLVMDVGDVIAGLSTEQFDNVALGLGQSAVLFLIPGLVSIVWLWRATRSDTPIEVTLGRGDPA